MPRPARCSTPPYDPATLEGHQVNDTEADTTIVVRAYIAGASGWFVEYCSERNLEFSFGHQIADRARQRLLLAQQQHWSSAQDSNGRPRHGSHLLEITDLSDLNLPARTRVIARTEQPRSGPELSVFYDLNG